MSFGRRLRLFFAGIVVVPLVVLAVLVLQVSNDSRDGQADARLAAGLNTARALYDEAIASAPDEAKRIATQVGPTLTDPDRGQLQRIAERARSEPTIAAVRVVAPSGMTLASAGPADAIAVGRSEIRSNAGGTLGTVRVAILGSSRFTARLRELTRRDVALVTDGGTGASTTDVDPAALPDGSASGAVDVQVPGRGDTRAAALSLSGAGPGARLVILTPVGSGFVASEPLVAIGLALFFAVAFLLIALLLRNLQARVAAMLAAARSIGEGNFDHRVPIEGNDEMAGLARELNRMSDRLSSQMAELRRQRREIDESIRRIGEAFASGLDRTALLELVAETAASACGAEAARVTLGDRGGAAITAGSPEHLEAVLEEAGDTARIARGDGEAGGDGTHSIGQALIDRSSDDDLLCVLSVARRGEPFSNQDREALRYLLAQTMTSIENIDLHERVSEQALTDDLTGISNYRQFREWLVHELARVERFGGRLALVLLDIDDFKIVNDSLGHLVGDRVLQRIGEILRRESRTVDLAARYGGEEFVLALPETAGEGAVKIAERLREAIASAGVSNGDVGEPVAVTASLGIAVAPDEADDARSLIAAADRALYEAKQRGKNRVVRAADLNGREELGQGNRIQRRN